VEDGCLVGRSLAGPWQRGVAGPQAIVAMLQLPLPPGALQPLSAALPLHIRPAGVIDQCELQESAEDEALAGAGPDVDSLGV